MKKTDAIFENIRQFLVSLITYWQAWSFIKEHQPWKGLKEYGWVAKLVSIAAILLGLAFGANLLSWFSNLNESGTPSFQSSMISFFSDFAWENVKWVFTGGSKYLILILLEIIVFHFTRFTLEFLTEEKSDSSFNAFINAEIRMIKVAARSWVLEIITIALLGFVLGLFGMKGWKPFFGFFVQCYFVGFAMIDNYFEVFGATIKESSKMIFSVAGASVGIGLVAYLMMYIPIVGVIAAAALGSVAATMVMFKLSPPEQLKLQFAEPINEKLV